MLIKFNVGSAVWLVPSYLATEEFRNAVAELNSCTHGELVAWLPEEREAFIKVKAHGEVFRPL